MAKRCYVCGSLFRKVGPDGQCSLCRNKRRREEEEHDRTRRSIDKEMRKIMGPELPPVGGPC